LLELITPRNRGEGETQLQGPRAGGVRERAKKREKSEAGKGRDEGQRAVFGEVPDGVSAKPRLARESGGRTHQQGGILCCREAGGRTRLKREGVRRAAKRMTLFFSIVTLRKSVRVENGRRLETAAITSKRENSSVQTQKPKRSHRCESRSIYDTHRLWDRHKKSTLTGGGNSGSKKRR